MRPTSLARRAWESAGAHVDHWSSARRTAAVFAFMAAIYLPTATYNWYQCVDSAHVAIASWSLAERGTLDLSALERVPDTRVAREQQVTVDGALYVNRFPGAIFTGAGVYWAMDPIRPEGDNPDPVPGAVAGALFSAAAIAVLHLVLRHVAEGRTAMATAVTFGVVSGTWAVSADANWTHGPAQLWLAIGVLSVASGAYLRSGLGWALAIFTRPHLALVAATVGIWESVRERSLRPGLSTAALTSLGVVAYLSYNWVVFGQPSLLGGYGEGAWVGDMAQRTPWQWIGDLVLTLVHPLQGLLVYMPWLLPLVPSLRDGWKASPVWARSSAVGGLLYLLVQIYMSGWSGGDVFFGPRFPLEPLTLAAPLLLLTYQKVPERRRPITHALLVAGALVHAAGAIFELRA